MDTTRKIKKVYVCSNVGLDYFFFLCKTIQGDGFNVIPIYLLSEQQYRLLAKFSGFKKIWLRIKTYVFYPVLLFTKALFAPSGSIFIVTSNTFYAPLLIALLLRFRKIKVIHLLYDLFPDAIEVAGKTKIDSNLSQFVGRITKVSQSICDGTVYLGEFLMNHTDLRWGNAKQAAVIHISTDLQLYNSVFNNNFHNEKLIFHYGGQLGHLHDAISLIECVKAVFSSELKDKVEFNFYISGAQAAFLKRELKDYPIRIISAIPSNQWREDIRSFHIGLVSLSPGGASVCLPSKTYGMMAGGLAIMAICPEWSDLAKLIKDCDAGFVINNSPYVSIENLSKKEYLNAINEKASTGKITNLFIETIRKINTEKQLLINKRKNAFYQVREQHNEKVLRNQWHEFIRLIETK
jgi:hypothetical protein